LLDFEETMKRGNDRTLRITAYYPEDVPEVDALEGDPMPLTGRALWFTAKIEKDDPDPGVFQKTDIAGITPRDAPANNVADVEIARADTLSLTEDATLYCDVQVRTADNKIHTIAEGTLTVEYQITQAGSL
jgi:hypothetical protein